MLIESLRDPEGTFFQISLPLLRLRYPQNTGKRVMIPKPNPEGNPERKKVKNKIAKQE
jgi:hypothetical protein